MSDNTANTNLNDINTAQFLEKVEEAAREGARQGSKESRGGRGGIGIFELVKTLAGKYETYDYKLTNFRSSAKDFTAG